MGFGRNILVRMRFDYGLDEGARYSSATFIGPHRYMLQFNSVGTILVSDCSDHATVQNSRDEGASLLLAILPLHTRHLFNGGKTNTERQQFPELH